MISVVDYGVGNLGSLLNMFSRVGAEARTTRDPEEVASASRIVLPGIGAFDHCMNRFVASGMIEPLREAVLRRGAPLLGVCVGMQMLTRGSEEGTVPGLALLEAHTVRIPQSGRLKIPHMGWDLVNWERESPLTAGLEGTPRFYFVHSYCVSCVNAQDVLGTCKYGMQFAAAVERGNIRGVQFHPEKSHVFGMRLLENFAAV